MPHLSKKKLSRNTQHDLDDYLSAFLTETSMGTRKRVFQEVVTKTERIMLAKRLLLLLLVTNGASDYEIYRGLGISPSTPRRFRLQVERGGYKHTMRWLKRERIRNRLVKLLVDLAAVPFRAQRKSLVQLLNE